VIIRPRPTAFGPLSKLRGSILQMIAPQVPILLVVSYGVAAPHGSTAAGGSDSDGRRIHACSRSMRGSFARAPAT